MHFPLNENSDGLDNRGYDELYFKGLISEHKTKVKKNGVIREVWQTTTGVRNEPLDLRVYNLGCMLSVNPHWDELQAIMKQPAKEAAVRKEQPKPARKRRVSKQTNIW